MKCILTKLGDEYKLYSHDSCIATTHESPYKILSLKNCQAIANGYDLDELACDEIGIDISVIKHIDSKLESHSSPCIPLNEGGCVGAGLYHMVKGFEIGFQKALKILGDKKFSEEDIRNAMERVWYWYEDNQDKDCPTLYELIPKHIQSLQQTEFDVEIEMVSIPADRAPNGWDISPKLDEDGCLILKRI